MRVLVAPPYEREDRYFDELSTRWSAGLSFGVQEHDIVSRETTWAEMEGCASDWCAAPYPYLDRERQFGLGFVKFSCHLIARHPWMFETIKTWHNDLHPPKHWCTLDSWIYQYLTGRGEKRCEDHSPVGHLGHPGKKSSAHGCFQVP